MRKKIYFGDNSPLVKSKAAEMLYMWVDEIAHNEYYLYKKGRKFFFLVFFGEYCLTFRISRKEAGLFLKTHGDLGVYDRVFQHSRLS